MHSDLRNSHIRFFFKAMHKEWFKIDTVDAAVKRFINLLKLNYFLLDVLLLKNSF